MEGTIKKLMLVIKGRAVYFDIRQLYILLYQDVFLWFTPILKLHPKNYH